MKATANQAGEKVVELREPSRPRWNRPKHAQRLEKGNRSRKSQDRTIREHPIRPSHCFGVGLLIGVARRRNNRPSISRNFGSGGAPSESFDCRHLSREV